MPLRRRLLTLSTCALLVAGLAAPGTAATSSTATATATAVRVPDLPVGRDGLARAVVAYRDGVVPDGALDLLDELGVVRGLELSSIGAVAVTAPQAVVELLASTDPRVVAVEPQRRLQLDLYASKGQLHATDMDTPEDYTHAGRSGTRPGVTGAGVTVAVLDSGIFSAHPDFGDRVTTGLHFAFSEIQDSGGISPEQWDDYAESTGTIALQDEIGHGTHVASTVGGSGAMSADAGGPNLAGVAPGVELVSMKVADAPFGIVEDLDWEEAALAAFDYIIRHPELGIDIAQNSWGLLPTEPNCQGLDCGEPTDFDAMAAMIGAVEDAGVTVVFSAGNDGPEPGTIGAYHRADQAILVGAACKSPDGSCPEGEITDFSSRGAADGTGPQVDVVAPGDQIMAAVSPSVLLPLTECPDTQQPGYYCISGTSMASPHVSGVAALMIEANPSLTPAQVTDCLVDTADDLLDPGVDLASGHGMVDARAAVACAHALTLAQRDVPTPCPAGVTRLAGAGPAGHRHADLAGRYPAADSARAVVLARADAFADGLAGTPLAAALGGPLLLTSSDHLDTVTRDEIARVLPEGGRVVLLGGPAALSDAGRGRRRGVPGTRPNACRARPATTPPSPSPDGVERARRPRDHDRRPGRRLPRRPGCRTGGDAPAPASSCSATVTGRTRPRRRGSTSIPDLDLVAVGGPAARAHPDAREVAGADPRGDRRRRGRGLPARRHRPSGSPGATASPTPSPAGSTPPPRGLPVLLSARDDAAARTPPTHVDGPAPRTAPWCSVARRRSARTWSASWSSACPERPRGSPRTGHRRQDRISVTMIPRAPTSQSSSITRFWLSRSTMARTATQPLSCSGDTVGDSMPGVMAQAASTCSTRTS